MANEICDECKKIFEDYTRVTEEWRKRSRVDIMPVLAGSTPHWNDYYIIRGDKISSRDFAKELQIAFYNLAIAASKPSMSLHNFNDTKSLLGRTEDFLSLEAHRLVKRDLGESIIALQKIIKPMLEEAYERGKQDGENLLMRLATGDITINDFHNNE